MNEIIKSIFELIGGVAVFMFGMKLMSEGLEHGAGSRMRKLLGRISNNRISGLAIGTVITATVQSSSATTVMVVGFVNAGIMTLFQAACIIIGANIGTTVTGLMAAFSSFNVTIYFGALGLIGIFFVMFSKNDKLKTAGHILSGFGLIFIGLKIMGGAFNNDAMRTAMISAFATIDFPLLLVLISIAFTAVIQSSSAVSGIAIAMVGSGALTLVDSLYIIIGANVGTCVTALIAAAGATVNAKRASIVHLLFNLIGTIIFIAIVWIFSANILALLQTIELPEFRVAVFHTAFNMITALVSLPFVGKLVKLAEIILPDSKVKVTLKFKTTYIDDRLITTPSIAIEQVDREVMLMAENAKANLIRGFATILSGLDNERQIIEESEDEINFHNRAIAKFLIKISSVAVSESDELHIGSLHHVINDIERIGDHAENFIDYATEMNKFSVKFTNDAKDEIGSMYNKVVIMYDKAINVLSTRDSNALIEISEIESEIDAMKREFGANHIERLNAGACTVDSGPYFYAVVSALERIGDHLTNIAFSIKSPSGSQTEALGTLNKDHRAHEHR
ncbi:MAG: Na/Pi cotransporter family protein [Christensenellaceae bacterium]|jgi:phosphate:Na+ symporter|nr:Na/Pi cotransporter family protein [Christensenellaceae bacterium]